MSLVPMLFSDWLEHLEGPHRLLDQDFGLGLRQNDLLLPHEYHNQLLPRNLLDNFWASRNQRNSPYLRPWMASRDQGGTSVVKADKDQFQVSLDIQHFKPDEISVKVVDKFIVVECKHEEIKDEHGFISRQFTRKYLIPEQCNIDEVKSTLSSDGVLSITVPRKQIKQSTNEIPIKIVHTGKPAIDHKADNKPGSTKDEKK